MNKITAMVISILTDNLVEKVYPSHCTDNPALELFYGNFGKNLVRTGEVFNF
ncbi:MAG: hypothetical protein K9J30_11120 [Bacteroidales bacterium]|nr:hypothetical protein [Bacteroidales bacterium]